MNYKQLCEEIAKREKAKGREVNITEIRTVVRHFLEILSEGAWWDVLRFMRKYHNYYRKKRRKKGGKG